MTQEELFARLRAGEDTLTEMKTTPHESDVRRALVALANSAPPERAGVLFLGAQSDGRVVSVQDPTRLGEKVARWAAECYPPIHVECVTLAADGGNVLAVVVAASAERPHFAAPAYVRDGPRTVKAPPTVYDNLIASRNTKAGLILRHMGKIVSVVEQERWAGGWNAPASVVERAPRACQVKGCSAHSVELLDTSSSRLFSLPLDRVEITVDTVYHRAFKLTITGP